MPIPGWMKTEDTIMQFFNDRKDKGGEYSVRQVADSVWLSSNTTSQYLRYLNGKGILTRRIQTGVGSRYYVYRLKENHGQGEASP